MRHGNISNELAPSVGMRFERVIKTEEGKLNRAAKAFLSSKALADINTYIITTGEYRKALAFCVKWHIPYTAIIKADSTLEVPDIVREHDMVQYWDTDINILQNVNSRGSGKVDVNQWTLEVL